MESDSEHRLERLVRKAELPAFTGLKYTQVYEEMKRGNFPRPIQLSEGGTAIAWLASETQLGKASVSLAAPIIQPLVSTKLNVSLRRSVRHVRKRPSRVAGMLNYRPACLETIHETPLSGQHLVVRTFKSADPFLLRPFLTFVRDTRTGEASSVQDYTCPASALHAHEMLTKKWSSQRPLQSLTTLGVEPGESEHGKGS